MKLLARWIINALVILAASYILPGVTVSGFVAALVVALVLGALNILIKPILIILTLPITIITFGLFVLVINTGLIMLASALVPGFAVAGFWNAFLFGIVLSITHAVVHKAFK